MPDNNSLRHFATIVMKRHPLQRRFLVCEYPPLPFPKGEVAFRHGSGEMTEGLKSSFAYAQDDSGDNAQNDGGVTLRMTVKEESPDNHALSFEFLVFSFISLNFAVF